MPTIHRAAAPSADRQFQACVDCGHVFHDYRGQEVMVHVRPGEDPGPMPCWATGGDVLVDGGMQAQVDDLDRQRWPRCTEATN